MARARRPSVLCPASSQWHCRIFDKTGEAKALAILSAEQAAAALAHDPAQAEDWARSALKLRPTDPTALLILGSARRRRGDPQSAYSVLAPLAASHPRAVHTHFELGATLAALGRTAEAIAVLRRTTALNPDLPEAWRALSEQLFREGDISAAAAASAEQLRASIRNYALRPAARALSAGKLAQAESELRAHLAAHPDDKEALQLMGDALKRLGRFSAAETELKHCLELDSGRDGARFAYAEVLLHQQKAAEALPQAELLLRQKPDDPAYLNLLATSLGLIGDDQRVLEIYKRLSEEYPKQPLIWLNYGHAQRTVGRSDDAAAAYRRCMALAPGLGDAYWSLANLKLAAVTAIEEDAMRVQLSRSELGADDRLHLHYALGKALEDRGDYASSFSHYRQGAVLRKQSSLYDADEISAFVDRAKAVFTSALFADRRRAGDPSTAPIFIVGLPRSGSTLIEQILASHSMVEGTRELPDIGFIAHELGWMRHGDGAQYPGCIAALDDARLAAFGRLFLDRTRIHRKLGRAFFIDKMPNNFLHVGLIRLILPQAKIIEARRHPLAACFSAYKQHFAQGQLFSYDLVDLGRYYRDYLELMHHFDAVLPGHIHRVVYEDLVESTEPIVRGVLAYCGLPFEDACLTFYRNDRPVRTASSEQVRRPIFRDGVDQWRRYEPWLGPLKDALGPALANWRS